MGRLVIFKQGRAISINFADYYLGLENDLFIGNNYALLSIHRKRYYLHRVILGANLGEFVDHVDGNKLNNCKCNLRLATKAENAINSKKRENTFSKYRGVIKNTAADTYTARCGGIYLGSFKTQELAALAYNKYALTSYGPFAKINILGE